MPFRYDGGGPLCCETMETDIEDMDMATIAEVLATILGDDGIRIDRTVDNQITIGLSALHTENVWMAWVGDGSDITEELIKMGNKVTNPNGNGVVPAATGNQTFLVWRADIDDGITDNTEIRIFGSNQRNNSFVPSAISFTIDGVAGEYVTTVGLQNSLLWSDSIITVTGS